MRTERWVVCAALACAAATAAPAFEGEARSKIALDALRLAPPALQRQLSRHRDALVRGARQEPPHDVAAAARHLSTAVDAAVGMIDSHRSFRKISEAAGRLAGALASLNDPLWGETEK